MRWNENASVRRCVDEDSTKNENARENIESANDRRNERGNETARESGTERENETENEPSLIGTGQRGRAPRNALPRPTGDCQLQFVSPSLTFKLAMSVKVLGSWWHQFIS